MKCSIVDYGTGNLQSVQNALEHLGHTVSRSNSDDLFTSTDVVIFPGQGSFGPAIQKLDQLNLKNKLIQYVESKKPFIGICLGYQLLFNGSEESSNSTGLGCFKGNFNRFKNSSLSVPHMGWNSISTTGEKSILNQFNNERFYFVHSYFLPSTNEKSYAITDYGVKFVSAIANKTQLITQFHPEKSGDVGLALLDSFLKGI
ncbi:MAG: imidazole glycerol phosphate synthase subunit HisH [Candidatus Margulisiibacteriota bacterium]|nr:imidazole glycerol phosphate synthase subunit HisH [Candidatus Margulisiibacteriota bacterium]